MIYQELSLARPISIAENLLVGRLPRKYGVWLDRKEMVRQASRLLDRVGLDLDPLQTIEAISQHQAQLVEIAKVLGLTESRVCQLHAQARSEIRARMKAWIDLD